MGAKEAQGAGPASRPVEISSSEEEVTVQQQEKAPRRWAAASGTGCVQFATAVIALRLGLRLARVAGEDASQLHPEAAGGRGAAAGPATGRSGAR